MTGRAGAPRHGYNVWTLNRVLPNLLVLASAALCGLCAFGWFRSRRVRDDLWFGRPGWAVGVAPAPTVGSTADGGSTVLVVPGVTSTPVLGRSGPVVPWGVAGFEGLTVASFEAISELQPEVVVFGSGERLRFPKPALLQTLMKRRIGLETMDTPAACRTYNVLLAEGRSVVAALLFDASRT